MNFIQSIEFLNRMVTPSYELQALSSKPVSQTCICLHDVNLVMTYCIPLQVVHSFLMAVQETIPVAMNK